MARDIWMPLRAMRWCWLSNWEYVLIWPWMCNPSARTKCYLSARSLTTKGLRDNFRVKYGTGSNISGRRDFLTDWQLMQIVDAPNLFR